MKAQVRPSRFKLAWFVAGIAVLPLSMALATLPAMIIDSLNLQFVTSPAADRWMAYLAIFWLVNGCCIGFLQKAIVKRYLHIDLGRWMVYSALGALLAGSVAYPCLDGSCLPAQFYGYRVGRDLSMTVEISIIALLYLTVFSAVQCLALNRLVRGSWRWIAVHFGSLILAAIASAAAQILPGASYFNAMLSLGLYVLIVTTATGIVMQRMLTANRNAAQDSHDDWAYHPASIESESASERSVWDDAI